MDSCLTAEGTRLWNSVLTTVFALFYLTILVFGFLNFEPTPYKMFVLNDINSQTALSRMLGTKCSIDFIIIITVSNLYLLYHFAFNYSFCLTYKFVKSLPTSC